MPGLDDRRQVARLVLEHAVEAARSRARSSPPSRSIETRPPRGEHRARPPRATPGSETLGKPGPLQRMRAVRAPAPRRRAAASGTPCRGSRARPGRSPSRRRRIASRSSRAEELRHRARLVDADAVLAGERAAGVDADVEDRRRAAARRARPRPRHRLVVEHERVQVAVAGVEDARDPQAVLVAERVDPPQHLGQPRARDDAVLDVVARRDPAHRRERRLAAAPDRARAPPAVSAACSSNAPHSRQIALDRGRVLGHLRRRARRARRSAPRRRRPGSPGCDRRLDRLERERVHHLDRGRQDPGRDHVRDGLARGVGRLERRRAACAPSRARAATRTVIAHGDPERALGADERRRAGRARRRRARA